MHSTHNEGESVIAERFTRPLMKKTYSIRRQYQKLCILIN